MERTTEPMVLELMVPGSPEELKTWWTDLPETYEAEDPREQPHAITLMETREDSRVYDTVWRGPLGIPVHLKEILYDEGPGRWRFVVPNPGFVIEDRYTAEAHPEGTKLTIRSTITYESWLGRLTRPLMLPGWRDTLRDTFSTAATIYTEERQA
ncbi:MAG: hypothetical protein R3185_06230 [Candidatus Thermoplasmatota archaeon]|nr:hypothetical protein [Candidatus Thermoplasmatota archaeon]